MTTCDTCSHPGICCREFALNGATPAGGEPSEVNWYRAEPGEPIARAELSSLLDGFDLPFRPLARKTVGTDDAGEFETWSFHCPAVSPEGRCTIYEARPAICRRYEPGQDAMCAHHPDFTPPGEPRPEPARPEVEADFAPIPPHPKDSPDAAPIAK